jgi:hypothetical protein
MSVIEATQAELFGSKNRMLQLMRETPNDRLTWKPSPSARSIIENVAHAGNSLGNILLQIQGVPFWTPTSAEANAQFLAHDAEFRDREETEAYLEQKCADYVAFLSTLKPEDLDGMRTLPFGLGQAPLGYFMTMGNLHTLGHIAQIEYIQTLYGDHDWHAGF